MSDIKDEAPPLPEPEYHSAQVNGKGEWRECIAFTEDQTRQIEAVAFARGVAAGKEAMQGEIDRLKNKWYELCRFIEPHVGNSNEIPLEWAIKELQVKNSYAESLQDELDELRAKLQALEEQKPVAWMFKSSLIGKLSFRRKNSAYKPLYTSAGAKP